MPVPSQETHDGDRLQADKKVSLAFWNCSLKGNVQLVSFSCNCGNSFPVAYWHIVSNNRMIVKWKLPNNFFVCSYKEVLWKKFILILTVVKSFLAATHSTNLKTNLATQPLCYAGKWRPGGDKWSAYQKHLLQRKVCVHSTLELHFCHPSDTSHVPLEPSHLDSVNTHSQCYRLLNSWLA